MLGELETTQVRRALIADMEAGLGTLTRMNEGTLDVVLLVSEPSPKAIGVVCRAAEVLSERRVAEHIVVVANKTRSDADVARVTAAVRGLELLRSVEVVAVPEDLDVLDADARGISPIDGAPDSPAVLALRGLAAKLVAWADDQAVNGNSMPAMSNGDTPASLPEAVSSTR
ncbi:MAG TPA: hypothetical protein VFO60_12320 [Candidatus Dormibacteraeota bacterium]|nr:hypothetical protein [Candidatus Dormibacteraeota bacterium]